MLNIVLIIALTFLLLLIFLYWQNKGLRLNKIEYFNMKIPQEFNDYKILHLSDFHNDKTLLEDVVKMAKKQNPDVIFISGDIIDSRRTDKETAIKLLIALNKIAKVHLVTGNHENRMIDLGVFKESALKTGSVLLDDRKITIKKDGDFFSLIGVSDPDFQKKNKEKKEEKYIRTLKKLSNGDDTFKILLAHRPEYFNEYIKSNYDLILAGHAHGGQFSIPFTDIGVFVPDQGFFAKYSAGIKKEENSTLIINRGIGNSIFPFRLFNRPEIILITLKNH